MSLTNLNASRNRVALNKLRNIIIIIIIIIIKSLFNVGYIITHTEKFT